MGELTRACGRHARRPRALDRRAARGAGGLRDLRRAVAWSVGYSGNILADFKAKRSEDTSTVPIGLQVAKVAKFGKLPVRFALAGQWMPVHPEEAGQKWNIEIIVAPVIPKLIKGNLADPSSLRARGALISPVRESPA